MSNQRTSQKHRNFVAEPMGTKLVTSVPGVGNANGQRLSSRGYHSASQLYGQYLIHGDSKNFSSWMKENTGASSKHTRDTCKAYEEWTRNNL